FHRLERRVKAHILVAFLGYALWVNLKHLLRGKNIEMSPAKALALLSTLQSADIVLPTTEAREIRLRRITNPSAEQQNLLARLNLTLPERIGLPLEGRADSAVACLTLRRFASVSALSCRPCPITTLGYHSP